MNGNQSQNVGRLAGSQAEYFGGVGGGGGGGGGGGTTAAPNKSCSLIEGEHAALEDAVSGLHKTISELEMRLRTVLTMSPADDAKQPEQPPTSSNVAARIGASRSAIHHAINRMRALLDRLEV